MSSISVAKITERFFEEQSFIMRYTTFLQERSKIFDKEIIIILDTLVKYNILEEHIRNKIQPWDTLDYSEIIQINQAILECIPKVEKSIEDVDTDLKNTSFVIESIDEQSIEGNAIRFFYECFVANMNDDSIDYELAVQLSEIEDKEIHTIFTETNIETFKQKARYIYLSTKRADLLEFLHDYQNIRLTLKIMDQDGIINSFRQGFILLITLLDATIFDMIKYALDINFFSLINYFEKYD